MDDRPSEGSQKAVSYYPFWKAMTGWTKWVNPFKEPYTYTGKKEETMHGLGWYDYGRRFYDPNYRLSFISVDPLCEKYYSISPYAYCANNPIKYIDPNGLWVHDSSGWYTEDINDIERFLNMIRIENDIQESVSKSQLYTFINEEYKGTGGRLSDGSVLLSEVSVVKNEQEEWDFPEYQKMAMLNEIDKYGSFILNDYDYYQQTAGLNGDWKHIVGPSLILLG